LVQRLFSMFPRGAPGIGLLFLRFSVALAFLANAIDIPGIASAPWLMAGAVLISLLLGLGLLTPLLSVLATACAGAHIFTGGRFNELWSLCAFLEAAALGLLGPGAYAVDAWLFGRRVLVIPSQEDSADR
jgi:hypothetical protein